MRKMYDDGIGGGGDKEGGKGGGTKTKQSSHKPQQQKKQTIRRQRESSLIAAPRPRAAGFSSCSSPRHSNISPLRPKAHCLLGASILTPGTCPFAPTSHSPLLPLPPPPPASRPPPCCEQINSQATASSTNAAYDGAVYHSGRKCNDRWVFNMNTQKRSLNFRPELYNTAITSPKPFGGDQAQQLPRIQRLGPSEEIIEGASTGRAWVGGHINQADKGGGRGGRGGSDECDTCRNVT